MTELRRELGLFSCTMLVAGNMIGIGIFVTAGRIYNVLPDPLWIMAAWVIGGLLSLAGGLAYAELATRFPRAGGGYVYLREAFGPFMGFLSGFSSSMVTLPGTAAFLAIGFTKYAGIMDPLAAKAIAIGLIWIITVVNYYGVVWGAELQDGFMVLKLLLIFLLIGAGFLLGNGSFSNFTVAGEHQGSLLFALPLALIPVMYTYSGWDATVYVAGEVKNPGRTIPLSLFFGCLGVTLVYLSLACLYLYAIPVNTQENLGRIVATASGVLFNPRIGGIVGGLVAVSILGCLSATILTGPRVMYAMAKDGLLPSWLSRVHPKFATPSNAILFQAVWATGLVLTGTFDQLLDYVTVPMVFFNTTIVIGLFFIRKHDKKDADAVVQPSLGFPVLPVLFIIGMSWILVSTVLKYSKDSLWGLLIVSLGIPFYFIWRKWGAR